MSWAKRYEICKILFGKPEGKIPRMRRWKNVPEKHAKTVCGGLHLPCCESSCCIEGGQFICFACSEALCFKELFNPWAIKRQQVFYPEST